MPGPTYDIGREALLRMTHSQLQQGIGLGSSFGGLSGMLGQAASGSQQQRNFEQALFHERHAYGYAPSPQKPRKEGIQGELQAEVDEWLKDIP